MEEKNNDILSVMKKNIKENWFIEGKIKNEIVTNISLSILVISVFISNFLNIDLFIHKNGEIIYILSVFFTFILIGIIKTITDKLNIAIIGSVFINSIIFIVLINKIINLIIS